MSFKEQVFLVKTEFRLNERLADKAIEIARATVERAEERMKIHQSTLDRQAAVQKAETERLKAAAWEKLRYSSDASQEAIDATHGERCAPVSRESILEQGLHSILAIQKKESGLDWEEIEEAQRIAKDTLQRAEAAGLKMGTCPACNGTKVTDPGYPDVSCPACSPLMAHRKPAPIVQDDDQGRIKMRNAEERERVLAIATRIVAGQVAKGEVDPNNEDALRAATQEAVKTAVEAYRAAVDFVFG